MPEDFTPLMISAISAGSALFGVAIGSVCSYFISKQQIRSTVLSGNRQQWVNTLRDCISEFQTKATIAIVESRLANHKTTSDAANATNYDDAMMAMRLSANKIALLINPKETDHAELVSSLKELESHCIDGGPSNWEREQLLQENITAIGQRILKREWERVKKVE